MSTRSRAIALGVALLLLVACTVQPTTRPSPPRGHRRPRQRGPSHSGHGAPRSSGARSPYRLVHARRGWQLSEVDGAWTSLDQFAAGEEGCPGRGGAQHPQ